ncbi:MAG TPA: sigma-70 family RNA polymerase sigma factor, partial [bacterium]|nr:sigma-70 family RNA polymerase sigma factor [bacterium]
MAEELTEAAEEKLWQEYRLNKSLAIRNRLIEKYAPLVKYLAGRLAISMPPNVEEDDLVGYGVLGLIDAIDKFDPAREVKFRTYASTRIRGAMYDHLREIDWVP